MEEYLKNKFIEVGNFNNSITEDKIKAAKISLLSFVLGDMLGTPIQFIQRNTLREYLSKYSYLELVKIREKNTPPFGYWSDDTSMTLCTLASILEKKEIDLKDIIQNFIKWVFDGYMTPDDKAFDIGNTTFRAIQQYSKDEYCCPKGRNDINSNGNGSLMRILPISLYCYFKDLTEQETFEIIKNVSSITHAHAISVLGCFIYTLVVFDILDGKSKDEIIANLKNIYNNKAISEGYKEWLEEYNDIINGDIITKNTEDIDSSGYVKSTLGVALWGFYNNETVENCIFRIIELGHDSDTNGAVGASLSGLYYGLRGDILDKYWTDKIIKKDMIYKLIEEYIKIL